MPINFDYQNILVFGAFVINIALCLLIHLRTKKTKANITFEITALSIAGWCLAMIFYRSAPPETAVFWTKVLYFFPTFIPTAFLLFGLYFPNDKIKKSTLYIIIALNVAMSLLVIHGGSIIQSVEIEPYKEKIIIFGPLYYIFYFTYITGFFLASYWVLFQKYRKGNPYVRMQILYILLGMTAASVPAMITNLNLPTFGYFEVNWIGQLFTIYWVGGVSYAIIKHRLLDIRFVIARTLSYVLLVVILGIIYALGLYFIIRSIFGSFGSSSQLLASTSFAVVLAFIFQPLRVAIEKATDKILFKNTYNSQALLKSLSDIMATSLGLDNLANRILDQLITGAKITRGVFVILTDNQVTVNHLIYKGYETFPVIDMLDVKKIFDGPTLLSFEDIEEGPLKDILRKNKFSLVLNLTVNNEKIGLLCLGEKLSGDFYSEQELEMFEILAPELSVAVHNSEEYEQIKRFNITLKDEVARETKQLQDANIKLQDLDKLKDEFVSLASHELRTPMTVIKSYVWTLLNSKIGPLNDKQKQYLDNTYTSTERLINLVNDMLNVSRIESGRLTIEPKLIEMNKFLGDIVVEMKTRADELEINLSFTGMSQDVNAKCDADRIKEVVINLIGNSIKFTPKDGSIIVGLNTDNGFAQISIKDTGRGISQEDMQKLFQKFNMVGNTHLTKDRGQGTGLGLYLSKSLVELHGGKIGVTSDGEGKGSTFTFTLPLAQ